MVQELAATVEAFKGVSSHTRCFAHTVNLVVKSILNQFDVSTNSKAKKTTLDLAERSLQELAKDLDLEEDETLVQQIMEGEIGDADVLEGLVDEVALLSEAERAQLAVDVLPVKLVLVKVSNGIWNEVCNLPS